MKKWLRSLMPVFCALSLLSLPACATEYHAAPSAAAEDIPAFGAAGAFTDVAADAWYAEAVQFCSEQGIMGGTTGTAFSPNASMTRSMLATALYRIAGSPSVAANASFTDAAKGAWYRDAISWTSQSGLLSGYGNGVFGVDDPVTREQIAAVLWRYAESPMAGTAADFADTSLISNWALSAVNWVSASGILNGKSGNRFDPKATLTRGEAAVLLYRYLSGDEKDAPSPFNQILVISVGGKSFTVVLEDNASAHALAELLPLTVTMGELNGNEKYYYLPERLPTESERPGTIQAGDLMLYGSDCLVLFYERFPSAYSYTRLGRIVDPAGLAEAVGSGAVEATFQPQAQAWAATT